MVGQEVQRWVEGKCASGCPLCGKNTWDFGNADTVVTISKSSLTGIGSAKLVGARDPIESEVTKIVKALKNSVGFGEGTIRIPCDNCGYVLFLDQSKVLRA